MNPIQTVSVLTKNIPTNQPFFDKLFPLAKTGIEERSGAICQLGLQGAKPQGSRRQVLRHGKAGNLICPGTEEGYRHFERMILRILDKMNKLVVTRLKCRGAFMKTGAKAQKYLRKLISIYHAIEDHDPAKYLLHQCVRPPYYHEK